LISLSKYRMAYIRREESKIKTTKSNYIIEDA
jgi:hypothetical protein